MTRRTLLSALTAAIAGKESLQASSVDLQEIPVDSSKLYVLHIDSEISDANREALQKAWFGVFAPEKAPKLVVVDGEGARLSIAQPLGADDIEAAVERGIARAMKAQETAGSIQETVGTANTGSFYAVSAPYNERVAGAEMRYYVGVGNGQRREISRAEASGMFPGIFSAHPALPVDRQRQELLPYGLCSKCENAPVHDRFSGLCRDCDPNSARYDAQMAERAERMERRTVKEREWLAKQPKFDHFGNDWTHGNPALSTKA